MRDLRMSYQEFPGSLEEPAGALAGKEEKD
jgi:hypothetical protein